MSQESADKSEIIVVDAVTKESPDKESPLKIAELERLASNLNITECERQIAKRGKLPAGILNSIEELNNVNLNDSLKFEEKSSIQLKLTMNKVLETLLQKKESENEELKLIIANLEQRVQSSEVVFAENRTVETVTTVKVSKQIDQVANTQVVGHNNLNFEEMLSTIHHQEQLLFEMKDDIEKKAVENLQLAETFQAANAEKCLLSSNFEVLQQENLALKNSLTSCQCEIQNLNLKLQSGENEMKVAEKTVAVFEAKCVELEDEISKLRVECDTREKFCEEGSKTNFHLQKSNQAAREDLGVMIHNVKQISAEKVELLNKISNMEHSKAETDSCLAILKNELFKSNDAVKVCDQKLQSIKVDVVDLINKCMKNRFVDLNDLKTVYRHFDENNLMSHIVCDTNNASSPLEVAIENHQQRTDASPNMSDTESVVEIFDSRQQSKSPERSSRSSSSQSGSMYVNVRDRSKSRSRRSPSSRSSLSRRSLSRGRSCSRRRSSSPHRSERSVSRMSCTRRERANNRSGKYFSRRHRSSSRRRSTRHESPERNYHRSRRSSSSSPNRSRSRTRARSRSVSRPKSRTTYDSDERRERLYSRRNSESSSSASHSRMESKLPSNISTSDNHVPLLPPPIFKFEVPPELQGSSFDINSTSNQFPLNVFQRPNTQDQGMATLTPLTDLVTSKSGTRVSATVQGGGNIPLVLKVGGNGSGLTDDTSLNSHIQKFMISVQKAIPGYHHGKHPIRELDEQCDRHRWKLPIYVQEKQHGEYFFNVKVNGQWYHPKQGSTSSRDAKCMAAIYCLQELGIAV